MVLSWALQRGVLVLPRSAEPWHIRENARLPGLATGAFNSSGQSKDGQSQGGQREGAGLSGNPKDVGIPNGPAPSPGPVAGQGPVGQGAGGGTGGAPRFSSPVSFPPAQTSGPVKRAGLGADRRPGRRPGLPRHLLRVSQMGGVPGQPGLHARQVPGLVRSGQGPAPSLRRDPRGQAWATRRYKWGRALNSEVRPFFGRLKWR